MKPLSTTLPKALFPVAGRPFLDHQLALLARSGATRVVLSVGYLGNMVRDHLAANPPPIPVVLCDDGPTPVGTGGALRVAGEAGLLERSFLVTYGDSYLPIDLRPLFDFHEKSGTAATMSVLRNDGKWDGSNCVVLGDRVVRYEKIKDPEKRPADMHWIDYGISALDGAFVASWCDTFPLDLSAPLSRLSLAGGLAAFPVTQRFYEIGSPNGLADLETLLSAPQQQRGGVAQ
jgi:NDP-sugar pyrophosphorylase family protein